MVGKGFLAGLLVVAAASSAAAFSSPRMSAALAPQSVLVIGGTRFSGLYLQRELHRRGHEVVLYNRGKTANKQLPGETDAEFAKRCAEVKTIVGDRQDPAVIRETLGKEKFYAVFDMNARELADTQPLADLFLGKVEHYVFMSSAGVYLKSDVMPHLEEDAVDQKSRHKGKLDSEEYLTKIGMPFTSIRPTYIYGALNYNPVERYFFERLDQDRPIIIPGHGDHITGLGHVQDLAVAFANVLGNQAAKGQIYNIQDTQSATFSGIARACAVAMGKDPSAVKIKTFDPKKFDFGKKKAFPMRPGHFFTGVTKAMKELDWEPKYSLAEGLKDSYENDFVHVKAEGGLKGDFECDDMVLGGAAVTA